MIAEHDLDCGVPAKVGAPCVCRDIEAEKAEQERLAQGLPARVEDPAALSRIVTAMRTTC